MVRQEEREHIWKDKTLANEETWGSTWHRSLRGWKTCPVCRKKIKPETHREPVDPAAFSQLCTCF